MKKSIPRESDAAFQMTQTRACLPTLAASAKTKRCSTGRRKKRAAEAPRATPRELKVYRLGFLRAQVPLIPPRVPPSFKTAHYHEPSAECVA